MGAPVGPTSTLERLIRHDRLVVSAGVVLVTLLAWWYLWQMAADMAAMGSEAGRHAAMGMTMPDLRTWGAGDFVGLFLMWTVMMAAMMLPSATPLLLLVVGTYRRRGAGSRILTAGFGAGYLLAWTAFSAIAAALQLALHRAAVLSPEMASRSAIVGGALLVLAGVYQWLPLKGACLTHCRSPLAFLTREWREGASGALVMGAKHGLYCVGCCWALMALLFAAGVMNLAWVGAMTLFVLAEKLVPQGTRFGRAAGVLLVAWGAWVMVR